MKKSKEPETILVVWADGTEEHILGVMEQEQRSDGRIWIKLSDDSEMFLNFGQMRKYIFGSVKKEYVK